MKNSLELLASLSNLKGKVLFDQLAMKLTKYFDVCCSLVSLRKVENPNVARTISAVMGDEILENFDYDLNGTPCDIALGDSYTIYPDNICELFPEDQILIDMKARSYFGHCVKDSHDRIIGLLILIDTKPLQPTDEIKFLLEILSSKIGGELESLCYTTYAGLVNLDDIINGFYSKQSNVRSLLVDKLSKTSYFEYNCESNVFILNDKLYENFKTSSELQGGYLKSESEFFDFLQIESNSDFKKHLNNLTSFRCKVKCNAKNPEYLKFAFEILSADENLPSKFIQGSFINVTEEVEAQEQLNSALFRAEEANNSKSEFLAKMSHEIRTPLHAIVGFTDILNKRNLSEKNEYYVNMVSSSADELLNLVNDILNWAKIDSGNIEIKETIIDINDVCEQIVLNFQRAASENLKITFEPLKNPIYVKLDEFRLKQVLNNLLTNAIKFTKKGEVSLVLNYMEKGNNVDLIISVNDTGIGIPNDQYERIFKNFEQAKGQNIAEYGGTGLGLAITKLLVQKMKGKISVESEVGLGSKFIIQFENIEKGKFEKSITISKPEYSFDQSEIVIVDDKHINIEIFKGFVEDSQIQVFGFTSPLKAIEALQGIEPKLIFIDLWMPELNGIDFLEQINGYDHLSNVPKIAYTATLSSEDEKLLKFDSILSKPAKRTQVLSLLSRYLHNSKDKPRNYVINGSELDRLRYFYLNKKVLLDNALNSLSINDISHLLLDLTDFVNKEKLSNFQILLDELKMYHSNFEVFEIEKILKNLKNAFESN